MKNYEKFTIICLKFMKNKKNSQLFAENSLKIIKIYENYKKFQKMNEKFIKKYYHFCNFRSIPQNLAKSVLKRKRSRVPKNSSPTRHLIPMIHHHLTSKQKKRMLKNPNINVKNFVNIN